MPSETVTKTTITLNNPSGTSLSTIDDLITNEVVSTGYYSPSLFTYSHVVFVQFNSSSAIICASDGTTHAASVLLIDGDPDTDFTTTARKVVNLKYFDGDIVGVLIDAADKAFPLSNQMVLSTAYHALDVDFVSTEYDAFSDINTSKTSLVGRDSSTATTINKYIYNTEKAIAKNSGYIEYALNNTVVETKQAVNLSVTSYSRIYVDIGYYVSTTWTSLAIYDTGAIAHERTATTLINGIDASIGTHVRITANVSTTDSPIFSLLSLSSVDANFLNIVGYDTTIGSRVTTDVWKFHMLSTVDETDTKTATNTVSKFKLTSLDDYTYAYASGSDYDCGIVVDDEQRDGISSDAIIVSRDLSFTYILNISSGLYLIAMDNDNDRFFITSLDSSLDRTDDYQTITLTVNSAALGYFTDTLMETDESTSLLDLTATIIAATVAKTAPYGLAMFGCGLTDFQRPQNTMTVTSYEKSSSGVYYFNKKESVMTADSAGDYAQVVETVNKLTASTDYEVFVESANMLFDPTFQSMMLDDNSILTYVSRAVSSHPTMIDWTSDGNYLMNGNEGFFKTGEVSETSDMDNTRVFVSATKQIVVDKIDIDDRIAGSIRIKIEMSKRNIEDTDDTYDDFKVFYIQMTPSGLFGLDGDGND